MGCAATRMIPDMSLGQLSGHTAGILGLCVFTVDGEVWLASASHDKTVKVWKATGGALVHTLEGHGDFCTAIVAYDSGGAPRIASGSADRTVRIWDPKAGKLVKICEGHEYFVKVMTTTKDDSGAPVIVSSALDGTIRTWRGDSGEAIAVIRVHPQPPGHELTTIRRQSLVAPPAPPKRGSMVGGAAPPAGGRKSRYSKAPVPKRGPPGGAPAPIFAIAADGAGTQLITGHADGAIKTWPLTSCDAPSNAVSDAHGDSVFALCVFAGAAGERCASGSADFSIKIWDLGAMAALVTIPGAHDEKVCALTTFAPSDGTPVKLVSGSGDMQLALWDAEATPELEPPDKNAPKPEDPDEEVGPRSKAINRLEGHTTIISAVVPYMAGDKQRVASSAWDGRVRLWDPFDDGPGIC